MRLLVSALAALLFAAPAAAQRDFTVRLDFANAEGFDDTDMALTGAPMIRAWNDSVSIYFNAELRSRGPQNLFRVAAGATSNYRALVSAIPILTNRNERTGATAYSVILFRAPTWSNDWVYLNSSIGYGSDPRMAARAVVDLLTSTLRAR